MNERLKELILAAGFPKFGEMYVVSSGEELERFAELVRQDEREECAALCSAVAAGRDAEAIEEAILARRDDLRGGEAEKTAPSQKPGKWVYPDWEPPETARLKPQRHISYVCPNCHWSLVVKEKNNG